jgi:hypothetical protein
VDFGNHKVLVHSKVDKYMFIMMELSQGIVKILKSVACIRMELCQIQEVQESMHCFHNACGQLLARKWQIDCKPDKNAGNVLVLHACNLR